MYGHAFGKESTTNCGKHGRFSRIRVSSATIAMQWMHTLLTVISIIWCVMQQNMMKFGTPSIWDKILYATSLTCTPSITSDSVYLVSGCVNGHDQLPRSAKKSFELPLLGEDNSVQLTNKNTTVLLNMTNSGLSGRYPAKSAFHFPMNCNQAISSDGK